VWWQGAVGCVRDLRFANRIAKKRDLNQIKSPTFKSNLFFQIKSSNAIQSRFKSNRDLILPITENDYQC
jgi:hypothetical protein